MSSTAAIDLLESSIKFDIAAKKNKLRTMNEIENTIKTISQDKNLSGGKIGEKISNIGMKIHDLNKQIIQLTESDIQSGGSNAFGTFGAFKSGSHEIMDDTLILFQDSSEIESQEFQSEWTKINDTLKGGSIPSHIKVAVVDRTIPQHSDLIRKLNFPSLPFIGFASNNDVDYFNGRMDANTILTKFLRI